MRAAISLLWVLLLVLPLRAQPAPPDTSEAARQAALATLTPPADPGFSYQAERVRSAGDSIVLEGQASVVHQSARLEAARIVYWRQRELVEAWGRQDSAGAWSGLPVLKRGSETLQGRHILYDLKDTSGTIQVGRVAYDKGYYAGQQIQARTEKEFLVRQGSYTTCDQEEPHFDFYSPRIKVMAGDMAVARPVYFRLEQHRLFWIPFYVFSLRQDRQSGVLTPGFGRRPLSYGSAQSEWELRNLGYYLAPSEYWDLALSADLRQRTGWLARARLNHAWRYHWNGEIETRLENRQQGSSSQLEWWTNIRHNQELGPTASLRASGTFQSNKDFGRNNSTDLQERLNRTLRSNLSFTKRWAGGHTFSLNASQTRNLDTQRSEIVFPELSLRSARKALWSSGREAKTAKAPWYKDWFYEGSGKVRHQRRRAPGEQTNRTGADLSLGLSGQQRPFPWLSFSPTLSENWTDPDLGHAGPQARGVRSERLNAGLALTQTYYGLFYPRVWRLTALRHVLKPSATLNYQAAHTDTGEVFGLGGPGASWKQERQLALRLDNTFWAKWLKGEEEAKVRLAQLNLSTNYALDRQRRPLSPLLTSLSLGAGQHLDTRLSLRSEFYDTRDHFQLWPRLQQFEVTSSLRFTGQQKKAGSAEHEADTGFSRDSGSLGGEGFGFESGLQSDIRRPGRGRQLQLSHYYSRSRSAASTLTRSWLRSALGFNRGRWRCDYSLNYDLRAPGVALLDSRRVNAELLSLQREFHDWTFTFNIKPSSFTHDRAFYFKFQFKDIPQLQFERGDSRR
ncbi:MAG: LPS-assembly protein LptD [Candidatus Latescibacteria bacterium]|nr:LPS-assembly protein LptD [Candidatus Latescibacterota bacterium]